MALGCTVALSSFAGLDDGPVRALDSALVILVEGGLQVVFLVTFFRVHPHWFRRRRTLRPARP